MEQEKPKKSNYNRERYEKNKDEILKNRREKYRKQTNKELIDIKVSKGTFTLYFNQNFFSAYNIYNVCVNRQREM